MCSEGMHALWISINLHTCMPMRFSPKNLLLTSWIVVHRDSGDLKSNEDQWKQEKHLIHSYPSVSLSGNVVLLSTHVVHSVWNRCQLWNLFGEWEWISSVNLVVSFSNLWFSTFCLFLGRFWASAAFSTWTDGLYSLSYLYEYMCACI